MKVGKFPFRAIGKAVAVNQTEGFVKIVASKEYGEVLGARSSARHATDLISEIVLGRTLETTNCRIGKTRRIRIPRCPRRSWKLRSQPRAKRFIFDRAI